MAGNAKVALLGTGIMGAAMARNLIAAGTEVRAWNRSREKAEPLASDGAAVFEDPAEAASGADFLLTMLSDADVIEGVVGNGVLPALADGAVWLQMSTVGERGNENLARLAAENDVAASSSSSTTGSWAFSACWPRRSRSPGRPAWTRKSSWRR